MTLVQNTYQQPSVNGRTPMFGYPQQAEQVADKAAPVRWYTDLPHRIAPVLALVAVNVFAVIGQAQWAYANLGHDWFAAIGFAATLESISLFLTAEASKAMLANVASGTLRLAAYTVGLLVGTMNYVAHAGPHWSPTAMAIAFGLLSALSPVLWTTWTRGKHRKQLLAENLIDPRTVKLPLALRVFYPIRSWSMVRLAVWTGENRPAAVRAMYAERAALRGLSQVDALRYAFGQLGHYEPHAARIWLQARGVLVDQAAIDAAVAGRPAPLPPAHTAPVSGPPADLWTDSDTHAVRLAALATKRDKIRYAFSVIGSYDQAAAYAWLAERGVDVTRSEVHTVAKAALAGPSGEHSIVSVTPSDT